MRWKWMGWNRVLVLGLVCAISAASVRAADLDVFPLHSQATAAIFHGRYIFLEVYSGRIEPYLGRGQSSPPWESGRVRLEWEKLAPSVQSMALRRIFPTDSVVPGAWVHRVVYPQQSRSGESLQHIAFWFTGNAQKALEIARFSNLPNAPLVAGASIRIPRNLLLPQLAALVPEAGSGALVRIPGGGQSAPQALPRPPQGPLSYGTDAGGGFALYKMQPGEVLYSDVVVRFTGRVDVYEVGEAAQIIQQRSGLATAAELPAGTPVKIPLDLLEAQYLPASDPQHRQYMQEQLEEQAYRMRPSARGLQGVALVLDAGHGGDDPGARGVCGVYEDEYVYDVVTRIARIVRTETQGQVYLTLRDRKQGDRPRDLWSLPTDHTEELLTSPRYDATDSKVSANLRWYLANSLYRGLVRRGFDRNKIVFSSFHADSRHPSAPGMMIYVSDAAAGKGSMQKTSAVYRRFAEVREQSKVDFTREERVRSEALSRDLAETVVASMNRAGVGVHSDVPIRGFVVRRRAKYVPAVIRYNAIPTKMLVEIANLAAKRACESMKDPEVREKVARAYVDALLEYFDAAGTSAPGARRS